MLWIRIQIASVSVFRTRIHAGKTRKNEEKSLNFRCHNFHVVFSMIFLNENFCLNYFGQRFTKLIELVSSENFGQVFITDTHPERMNQLFIKTNTEHSIFLVENGTVTQHG